MGCQFDELINRRNTQSRKWDGVLELFGEDNLIPMWIADMDFRPPEAVVHAVTERAAHGIYGYETKPNAYIETFLNWLRTRHDWEVDPTWISHCPGVVPGLALAILALTEPGDKVVIQPPVYPPFYRVIEENNRLVAENNLLCLNGRFTMDFANLEDHFKAGAKVLILCSPHNPVGRVWSLEELRKLEEITARYNVTVLSDEIWSDLAFPGFKHHPLASLSPEMAARTLTFVAPSKTFNIAGFYISNVIIPNPGLQNKFRAQIQRLGLTHLNFLGLVASEVAYRDGGSWLDQLLDYLQKNATYAITQLEQLSPKIKVIRPEGTFVLWIDFRELNIPAEELNNFFVTEAKIAFNDGMMFGPAGYGFQRMNIGCPQALITEAISRLAGALSKLN